MANIGEPAAVAATDGGSNCWVIHGSRTASGAPLVAGDPHLNVAVPGQWYVVHMECPEFTAAGPCNPGYPGPVFYGHNTKVAWAMTNAHGDRWDLYRERIRRARTASRRSSAANGSCLNCAKRSSAIRISDPRAIEDGQDDRERLVDAARAGHLRVARAGRRSHRRPLGPGRPGARHGRMVTVLRASTAAEARAGFGLYDSISGNYCFATTEGDIGYQYAGRIPRRAPWLVPMPGWDGAYEWQGDVPKDELPAEDNPASGYFASANNKTTTPDYPHYLSYASSRFRADRIRELVEGHGG